MDQIERNIMNILSTTERGLSSKEIYSHLSYNRKTTMKHLEMLKLKGIVGYKNIGMAKLWFVNESLVLNALDTNDDSATPLKEVLNTMGDGVSIIDKNMNLVWINKPLEKALGKKTEQVKGKKCYAIHVHRDEICEHCPAIQSFRLKETRKGKDLFYSKKGKKSVEYVTSPIQDTNQNVVGAIEIIRDINLKKSK